MQYCRIKTFIVSILATLYAVSMYAQVNRFPGQWVGDLFTVENMITMDVVYLIDKDNVVTEKITSITGLHDDDFPIPQDIRARKAGSGWHEDALHTLAFPLNSTIERNEDGSLFRSYVFTKWQDGKWHYLGTYKTPYSNLLAKAIPCDDNRFIFISADVDVAGNTGLQRSPFASMSLNIEKREVRLRSSIDHGQHELREYMSKQNTFDLAFNSSIIITNKHATVLNYKTGLYWIFSRETASLKKAGNVFKRMTPEHIAKGGFSSAILCAHPQMDGSVLISTQMEAILLTQPDWEAAMKALWDANGVGTPDAKMTVQDWFALHQERQKTNIEQSSGIDWYKLDPESGTVEKIVPPIGASPDRDGGKNDLWRPMPDGSVQMGATRFKTEIDKKEENASKVNRPR